MIHLVNTPELGWYEETANVQKQFEPSIFVLEKRGSGLLLHGIGSLESRNSQGSK
jgi:hypothetical protein